MAGSLVLLLDDIATVLDDVSVMTKVAAKKTAGVLGDDLALNAEQVSGVKASRELPVVWAVAKGSALNKLIIVPAALLISAFAPWAVTILLMIGGAFLCYEGAHKLAHKFLHRDQAEADKAKIKAALKDPKVDFKALEQDKIKGAIRTDFILSAEIIVISLGTVADKPFATQLGVLIAIATLVTVGVYGLVAGIVKLDDAGLALANKTSAIARKLGNALLTLAPWLMRFLSIAGTAAMFLVGGGIISHGIPALHHLNEALVDGLAQPWLTLANMGWTAVVGIVLGIVVVAVVGLGKKLFGGAKDASHGAP
jgi:predicted DNA repair protein MutK